MIIDALISLLMGILNGILGLAPSWDFSLDLEGVGATFGNGAGIAGAFFPIATVGMCLGLILGLKAALFLWNLAVFVYRLIPAKFT